MQQILELFEVTSNKVAIEQLSGEPLKEIFATDYQKYYGQNDHTNDTAYAKRHDCMTLMGDGSIPYIPLQ
jgi:hypothetical protein